MRRGKVYDNEPAFCVSHEVRDHGQKNSAGVQLKFDCGEAVRKSQMVGNEEEVMQLASVGKDARGDERRLEQEMMKKLGRLLQS